MTAVHFGAGNIGRGFIGLALHQAGHHVTFVDVDDGLIASLHAASSYRVLETGTAGRIHTVTDFSGLNSRTDPDAVVSAIAGADIVTTAVGPRVLEFIAPLIARGLAARAVSSPLAVMACENAVGATDTLRGFIAQSVSPAELGRAQFANTAVDRIIPMQHPDSGLDVMVEDFSEWVVDQTSFAGNPPELPAVHFVDGLAPYIDRKLFTVNTGHASLAYLGLHAGLHTVAEALADEQVASAVNDVLGETALMLVTRHHVDPVEQTRYIARTLERFRNPELNDELERVGRQPLRKLSRHERLIAPAASLAENGVVPAALLVVVEAALFFDVPSDTESVALQQLRSSETARDIAATVCGIETGHPLRPALVEAIERTMN